MRLIDLVNGPWAITADMHREIQAIYRRHRAEKGSGKKTLDDLGLTRRDPLSSASIVAASAGRRVENRGTYTVIDGVAVLPVMDVIEKRMSWWIEVCGGTSTQQLSKDFVDALNDPAIVGVIPYFDTPGGTVDGTMEAAGVIASARGTKPCVGFTDGMICSAGMWLAAGCDEIFISSDTNPIGSIGVVAAHVDVSNMEQMRGRKITEITSGDFKRIASSYSALTDDGRAYIQAQLDHIYTAFVGHVAPMRGLDPEQSDEWANGRIFMGSQAIDAGLVDGVSTLDDLIQQISGGKKTAGRQQKKKAAVSGETVTQTKEEKMDVKELREKHPDVAAAIEKEARVGYVTEAAAAEQAKEVRVGVLSLVSAGFGEEAGKKLAAAADKGLSAEDLKTFGISFAGSADADVESRKEILTALKDGGKKPLGSVDTSEAKGEKDFMVLIKEYQKANADASLADAMKAVAAEHPQAHRAYIDKANEGRE